MGIGMGFLEQLIIGLFGLPLGLGGPVSQLLAGFVLLLGLRSAPESAVAVGAPVPAEPFSVERFAEEAEDPDREDEAMGRLSERLDLGGLEPDLRPRVAELLAARLVGPRLYETWVSPAALLLRLEGEAALPRILRPEVLDPENPRLAETLEALRDRGLRPDESGHDSLIAALLDRGGLDERSQRALDVAVEMLALRGAADRLAELRGDPRAQIGALRGLLRLAGVDDPWAAAYSRGGDDPVGAVFGAIQGYAHAARWTSHLDFFGTWEANRFPAVIRVLKEEGHQELAALAREAALVLDARGWQKGFTARGRLVAALSLEARARLEELDRDLAGRAREIEACGLEFLLGHLEELGGERR